MEVAEIWLVPEDYRPWGGTWDVQLGMVCKSLVEVVAYVLLGAGG